MALQVVARTAIQANWFHAPTFDIAEDNGKRSLKDRSRFLDIARVSALECVAIQDILTATKGLDRNRHAGLKRILHRIVSMLTRLIARGDVVAETPTEYNAGIEYEYRDAEYEYENKYKYEYDEEMNPELVRAPKDGLRGFTNGKSIVRP